MKPMDPETEAALVQQVQGQLASMAPKAVARAFTEDAEVISALTGMERAAAFLTKKANLIPGLADKAIADLCANGALRPEVSRSIRDAAREISAAVPVDDPPPGSAPGLAVLTAPASTPISAPRVVVTVPAPAPVPPEILALQRLRAELKERFLERDGVIDGMLTAALAGEHVFQLGPPGTAKTALTLAFAGAIQGRAFVRLMSKFTTQAEIFGPPSIPDLVEGRDVRKIEGYAPTADVLVLDEIFKANSAILNSLLTLLHERMFDFGGTRIPVPLKIAFGCSNELPEDEGLGALYDRFLFRYQIKPVGTGNFSRLLGMPDPNKFEYTPIDLEALGRLVRGTQIPPETMRALTNLRAPLAAAGVHPSDRRWRKCLGVLQASAVLAGRFVGENAVAQPVDLLALSAVLWDNPEDAPKVSEVLARGASAPRANPPTPGAPSKPIPMPVKPASKPASPSSPWGNIPQAPLGAPGSPPPPTPGPRPSPSAAFSGALRGQSQGAVLADQLRGMTVDTGFSLLKASIDGGVPLSTLQDALQVLRTKASSTSYQDRGVPFAIKRQLDEWDAQARAQALAPQATSTTSGPST